MAVYTRDPHGEYKAAALDKIRHGEELDKQERLYAKMALRELEIEKEKAEEELQKYREVINGLASLLPRDNPILG